MPAVFFCGCGMGLPPGICPPAGLKCEQQHLPPRHREGPGTAIEVYSAYDVGSSDRGTVVSIGNGRGLTCFSDVD
jgi:hypothetical protein